MKKLIFFAVMMFTAMSATAQNLNVGDFTKIESDGFCKVNITKGDKCSVLLDASKDIAPYADIYVNEGELHIGLKAAVRTKKDSYMKVSVCLPYLEEIEVSGACSVVVTGKFNITGKEFKIDMEGASSLSGLDIDADRCSIELDGTTGLNMTGNFSTLELEMEGCSKAEFSAVTKFLDCEAKGVSKFSGIKAESANVEIDGTAYGELEVTDFLNAKLEGVSKLCYSGPETLRISKHISFNSKLEKK